MRRKSQIVLAITFMVAAPVSFSYIYICEIVQQEIRSTHEAAAELTSELARLANNAAPELTSAQNDPDALRRTIAYYLSTDSNLNAMLESVVGAFRYVYDASIVDAGGKVILHTDPDLIGNQVSERPEFQLLQNADFRRQLRMVYNPPNIYEVRLPLQLNGAPFGSVRLGINTLFIRSEVTPRLRHAVIISGIAILLSLLLAAGLSHIALGQPSLAGESG
ncbi:MAG TPA: hypothetical protein VEH30_16660 [Terriglobales bacterium]|nr:hypothetical protein [Terriglobales bacterium]